MMMSSFLAVEWMKVGVSNTRISPKDSIVPAHGQISPALQFILDFPEGIPSQIVH
jgi:hypothetical protein